MSATELRIEMKKHNENAKILADVLDLTPQGFSLKKKHGRFTPAEIRTIADRYDLSADRICEIFDLKGEIK